MKDLEEYPAVQWIALIAALILILTLGTFGFATYFRAKQTLEKIEAQEAESARPRS